jgi:hypothetical protein
MAGRVNAHRNVRASIGILRLQVGRFWAVGAVPMIWVPPLAFAQLLDPNTPVRRLQLAALILDGYFCRLRGGYI